VNLPQHADEIPDDVKSMISGFTSKNYFLFGTKLGEVLTDLVGNTDVMSQL
jgi:hypothetical protein